MKRVIIIYILMAFITINARAQEEFVIQGKIASLPEGSKVILRSQNRHPDTGIVRNGVFRIEGTVPDPIFGSISLYPDYTEKEGQLYNFLFLEKGTIQITGSTLLGAKIIGTPINNEYVNSGLKELNLKRDSIMLPMDRNATSKNPDMALYAIHVPIYKARQSAYMNTAYAYIKSHPDSHVSLYQLRIFALMTKTGPALSDPIFESISPRLKKTATGKYIAKLLSDRKALGIGKVPPDFKQPDTSGNYVTLNSFKGKYVLVEFWASWCAPCREESPYLVKAYEEFKGKNFEILSVSEDSNRKNWLKAIKDDHLSWIQVSDLKGTNNAAAKLWGVEGVPKNYLLDPKGVIIAQDLRHDELILKLREIIK